MSKSFEFEVVKPLEFWKEQVFWLDVEGLTGNFIVGPDHIKLVSILKPKGQIAYETIYNVKGKVDVFIGGVIYVSDNKVIAILED